MVTTGQLVTITPAFIEQGANRGSYKAAQLDILGVPWPPKSGWKQRVVGRKLTKQQADKFLALRNGGFAAEPIPEHPAEPEQPKSRSMNLLHPALDLLAEPSDRWWLLRFDGSCDANGSQHAKGMWAFHLQCNLFLTQSKGRGPTKCRPVTCNASEWEGVLNGLKALSWQTIRPAGILIEGDSKLVVETLRGSWKSKAETLTEYRDDCREILAEFGVPWYSRWIAREENEYCDSMTR